MKYRTAIPGLVACLGFVLATAPLAFAFAPFSGTDASDPVPDVSRIDCSIYPRFTHQFRRDGLAFYGFEGGCRITRLNGSTRDVRYHVDTTWDPKTRVAMEFARIYDLGNALPELFQPGTPGDPRNYTPFTANLVCQADPWLNNAQCGLSSLNAGDLRKYVPRLASGPYPVTKDAIPAAQRPSLIADYGHATGQIASKEMKRAPLGGQQPPPATPAYGATYAPAALSTLNRGQQPVTIAVTITNRGSLTWSPAGPNPFHLSYHWYAVGLVPPGIVPSSPPPNFGAVVFDGLRTNLLGPIAPGQSGTPVASVQAPPNAGTYVLKWDLIQEGVTWFSSKGVLTGDQTVVVK